MIPDFTRNLLRWHRQVNDRDMPWKGETDPYRVWLSEIILQQTRVEQGVRYYSRFLEQFPDIHALAQADEAEVFKVWEGLGYYSRCRNLLHTARVVAGELKGIFPPDYEGLLSLKGIGPYTAAAISSFVYNEKRAVVDGNVERVLARYFGLSTPVGSTSGKKFYAGLANSLIDEKKPGEFNQAIMDFGATVCKPRKPLCSVCVQSGECEAFRHGYTQILPVKEKKAARETRWFNYYIIEQGETVFIRKRVENDIWQDLHEFVLQETDEPVQEPGIVFLQTILGSNPYQIVHTSSSLKQDLSHQRIIGRFWRIRVALTVKLPRFIPVHRTQLRKYAFPRLINTYLQMESSPY